MSTVRSYALGVFICIATVLAVAIGAITNGAITNDATATKAKRVTDMVTSAAGADHQALLGRVTALETEVAQLRRSNGDLTQRLSAAAIAARAARVRAARVGPPSAGHTYEADTTGCAVCGGFRSVSSTMYCLSGEMANGRQVHQGAVAVNGVPFGTRYRVLSGPFAGNIYTVEDRIGSGSMFDVWTASCGEADRYGRHQITIQRV